MKLPVHAKLRKYIACIALCTGCHLLKYLRILETDCAVGISGLSQYGKIIIGHFCMGIGSLIDLMAYLMGNSPAIIPAALVSSTLVRYHRNSSHHAGCLIPLNTDVISGRIHECSCKHLHVTNIQILIRQMIFGYDTAARSLCKGICQTLMLIEQCHHSSHSLRSA